jgi:glycosyltransferase involved in cell wall biosynthesis
MPECLINTGIFEKTTMKIGVNLLQLNPGKIGGMEHYVRMLIKYILEDHEQVELFLFVTPENEATFHTDSARVHKISIDHITYGKTIFEAIMNHDISLYFCPLLVLDPVLVHIPTVVCIPDIQHEFFPEFFSHEVLEWRKLHFKASADAASALLTLSRFSAETIIDRLVADPKKVFPIHLAADGEFGDAVDDQRCEQVRMKYSLPRVYGYFPANTWPHKNHLRLLDALVTYRDRFGTSPYIVFSGAKDTVHTELVKAIRERNLSDNVQFVGYLPQEEVQYLYRNAAFLVFPSLFEGFGMPALEAMICDCPIICSNTTSLPEVAGSAALYFDPLDPAAIAEAMHRILTDAELRVRLVEDGATRARMFSWRQTTADTVEVFKKVIAAKPRWMAAGSPLVTVVTPSYNQGEFIEETIQSVLGQSYSNVEYLINDGGSGDQTVEILKKYTGRVSWVSAQDKGQGDAVNKGFNAARGGILGWLNSDDTYLPGAIEKVVEAFSKKPDALMVYGNAYYTNKYSTITKHYLSEPFDCDTLAHCCYICQPSVFIRKELFAELGDLDISLHTCMDYDYWIRVAKRFPDRVVFIDDFLATSRMYDENKTLALREKVYSEIFATVRKHYGVVPDSWIWGFIVDVVKGTYLANVCWPLAKILYWVHIYKAMRKFNLPRMARIALILWSEETPRTI